MESTASEAAYGNIATYVQTTPAYQQLLEAPYAPRPYGDIAREKGFAGTAVSASMAECARLAEHVYDVKLEEAATPIPGWQVLAVCDVDASFSGSWGAPTHYRAAVYFNADTQQLVIASRGTDMTSPSDLLTDLRSVVHGQVGEQTAAAWCFTEYVLDTLMPTLNLDPKRHLNLTGHSLGGWHATVVASQCLQKRGIVAHTVTFDAPNARKGIARLQCEESIGRLDVTNILYLPNLVNTANANYPIGRVLKVTPEVTLAPVDAPVGEQTWLGMGKDFIVALGQGIGGVFVGAAKGMGNVADDLFFGSLLKTLYSHSMGPIADALNSEQPNLAYVVRWPYMDWQAEDSGGVLELLETNLQQVLTTFFKKADHTMGEFFRYAGGDRDYQPVTRNDIEGFYLTHRANYDVQPLASAEKSFNMGLLTPVEKQFLRDYAFVRRYVGHDHPALGAVEARLRALGFRGEADVLGTFHFQEGQIVDVLGWRAGDDAFIHATRLLVRAGVGNLLEASLANIMPAYELRIQELEEDLHQNNQRMVDVMGQAGCTQEEVMALTMKVFTARQEFDAAKAALVEMAERVKELEAYKSAAAKLPPPPAASAHQAEMEVGAFLIYGGKATDAKIKNVVVYQPKALTGDVEAQAFKFLREFNGKYRNIAAIFGNCDVQGLTVENAWSGLREGEVPVPIPTKALEGAFSHEPAAPAGTPEGAGASAGPAHGGSG